MEEIINMPVDKLYSKAVEWKQINDYNNYYIYMTMAANYGHSEAIKSLSEDFISGGNLLQDHIVTLPFYEQTNKFNYSSHYLAYMYKTGRGIEKDYQKAVELYTRAIEKGNSHSMNNLGYMYYNGHGVEQNYQKAIELYTLAIEKGNLSSMNNLAIMYNDGNGVEQNYQKAIELYTRAIEKGCMDSLENLTSLYQDHKSLFNKKDIIDFFLIKYPNNLKTIFGYDSDMILCLQEKYIMEEKIRELEKTNKEFEKTIKELADHINLSPGGTEYFEVMDEWKQKSQCDS